MAIKNLVPRNDKEGKLGVESKKWKEVHAETGSFERIEGTFSLSTGSITGESGSFGVLKVTGDTKLSGSVHIGDSSTDYLYVNGLVSSSVIPAGSGSFDLGNEQNPWRDLYILTESVKFMRRDPVQNKFILAESFSKTDVSKLKEGKTLKEVTIGRVNPDVVGGLGDFEDIDVSSKLKAVNVEANKFELTNLTGSISSSIQLGKKTSPGDPDDNYINITTDGIKHFSGSDYWHLYIEDGDPTSAINGNNIVFEWGNDHANEFSPDQYIIRFKSGSEDYTKDVLTISSQGYMGVGGVKYNELIGLPSALTVTGSVSASGEVKGQDIVANSSLQGWHAAFGAENGENSFAGDSVLSVFGNISASGDVRVQNLVTRTGQIKEGNGAGDNWIAGGSNETTISTNKLVIEGGVSASGDVTASNMRVMGTLIATTGSFLHTIDSYSNITNYSASVFSGSVLISGSTPGYPATLTVEGNISASGYVSASTIFADEMFLASSSLFIGGEKLTSKNLQDIKQGRTLRTDRYTHTSRVRDYVDDGNYMHLGSPDRLYFVAGGKKMLDLDEDENKIYLGTPQGQLLAIQPEISASGDLYVSGSVTIEKDLTIGGNITIGDSNTDSLNISADLTSNLVPNDNLTYNLGSLTQRWNTLNVGLINATGNISSSGGTITGKKLYIEEESEFKNDITSSADIYLTDGHINLTNAYQIRFNQGVRDNTDRIYYISGSGLVLDSPDGIVLPIDSTLNVYGNSHFRGKTTFDKNQINVVSSSNTDIIVGNITSSVGKTLSFQHSNNKGTRIISDTDGTLKLESTYIGGYNAVIPNVLIAATGSTFGNTRVGIGKNVSDRDISGLTVEGSVSSSKLYLEGSQDQIQFRGDLSEQYYLQSKLSQNFSLAFWDKNKGGVGGYRFVVMSGSGNFGIGVADPDEKLEIDGNIKTSGDLLLNGGDIFVDSTKRLTLGATSELTGSLNVQGTMDVTSNARFRGFASQIDGIFIASGSTNILGKTGTQNTVKGTYLISEAGYNTFNNRTQFLAPLTASGDISSSGTIYARTGSFLHTVANTQSTTQTQYSASQFSGSVIVSGSTPGYPASFTVNGNISSSGTIYGFDIKSSGTSVVRSVTEISDSQAQQGNITFVSTDNNSVTKTISNLSTDSDVKFNHITASGGISSSGVITGDTGAFTNLSATSYGHINSTGNITSNGNISASGGDFTGETYTGDTFVGNLFTGSVSASGAYVYGKLLVDAYQPHFKSTYVRIESSTTGESGLQINNTTGRRYWLVTGGSSDDIANKFSIKDGLTGNHRLTLDSDGLIEIQKNLKVNGKVEGQLVVDDYVSGSDLRTNTGVIKSAGGITRLGLGLQNIFYSKLYISGSTTIAEDLNVGNISSSIGKTISWDHTGNKGNRIISDTDGYLKLQSIYGSSYGSIVPNDLFVISGSTFGNAKAGIGTSINSTNIDGLTIEGGISASGDLNLDGQITASTLQLSSNTDNPLIRFTNPNDLSVQMRIPYVSNDFVIDTNVKENALVIDGPTGNVGIGKTDPTSNLDVSGSIKSDSWISASSFIGDGTNLTGVTAEWDGTHTGNATITGELTVQNVSASGQLYGDNLVLNNTRPAIYVSTWGGSSTKRLELASVTNGYHNIFNGNISGSTIKLENDATLGNISSSEGKSLSWEHSDARGNRIISDTDGYVKIQNTYVGGYGAVVPNDLMMLSGSTFGNVKATIGTSIPAVEWGLTVQGDITASGNVYAKELYVDSSSIYLGGTQLTAADLGQLKKGRSLGPIYTGNSRPTLKGGYTEVESIYSSGSIDISGSVSASGHAEFGSIFVKGGISGSGDLEIDGNINCDGSVTSSKLLLTGKSIFEDNVAIYPNKYLSFNYPNQLDDRMFYSAGIGIVIQSSEAISLSTDTNINTTKDSGHALTVEGTITASGDLLVDGNNVDFRNLPTSSAGANTGGLYKLTGTQLGITAAPASSSYFVLIKN